MWIKRGRTISFITSLTFFLIVGLPFIALPQEEAVEEEEVLVGDPKAGERLVEELDCRQCHTILGHGGTVGPDLTQVALRRSKEWLRKWHEDPTFFRPSSGMPIFPWKSEQEVEDIIAYFDSIKKPVDSKQILKKSKNRVKAGEKLVEAYDCRACHRIFDGGIHIYPNLSHVGSKIRPEWDKRFLKDPNRIYRGTFMPNFGFTDEEIEAIVAYLMSLK